MHRRGRGDAWGVDTRQLRSLCREHLGQCVREILQQMQAVGHLAGHGSPGARRFRVCLRAIAHKDLNPRMGLKPLCDSSGLPIREEDQGPPPGEIQQQRAVGVTRPQRKIVYAEDLWGDHHGAGGTTDDPQEGVPTDGQA
jgi:hypothetical protein